MLQDDLLNKPELWEIKGDQWIIPVYVTWAEENIGSIKLPDFTPLTNKQKNALDDVLRHVVDVNQGIVYVRRAKLEMVGKKSNRQNPDDVLHWVREDHKEHPIEEMEDMDEFWDEAARTGWFTSVSDAKFKWAAFCQVVARMLVRGRTVDFGFIRLTALPLRADWIEVVFKCRGDGLRRKLHDPQLWMSSWTTNKLAMSAVYVKHDRKWWIINGKYEAARRKRYQDGYWDEIKKRINRVVSKAVEIFLDYKSQVDRPLPFFSRSRVPGCNYRNRLPRGGSHIIKKEQYIVVYDEPIQQGTVIRENSSDGGMAPEEEGVSEV